MQYTLWLLCLLIFITLYILLVCAFTLAAVMLVGSLHSVSCTRDCPRRCPHDAASVVILIVVPAHFP